jgi:N-dimethylarginine dimethylaminohydrolase
MYLGTSGFVEAEAPFFFAERATPRWEVASEYGRLTDVMVSAPAHLELVPCNAVARDAIGNGLDCCTAAASVQHRALVHALEASGARCHLVPPVRGLPDLSFTRDATLMTPWGLLGLRPAVEHRSAEVDHILAIARQWGVPVLGRIESGRVEGGDVCILREGIIVIGNSGDRTDDAGAAALGRIFKARGWRVIRTRFDPEFLHLDTQFCMVGAEHAVACLETLDRSFVEEIAMLGIEIVPAERDEVCSLGANVVSLGDRRVLASADNRRLNTVLAGLGYQVTAIDIDQFTRCGGGIHCLTLPLRRDPV